MQIQTQRDYYIRATSDGHKMLTLAQTEQRANALMCEDISRLDPFQRSQQQHDWANMPD